MQLCHPYFVGFGFHAASFVGDAAHSVPFAKPFVVTLSEVRV